MAKYRNQRSQVIKKPKKKKRKFFRKLFLLSFLVLFFGGISYSYYLYNRVPELNLSLFDYNQNAIIYDRYGNPYQNLQGEENRQTITSEEIPSVVKNAFIAVEDKRFYDHHGIDLIGTGRAILEVFINRDLSGSGGSTITQQLIKQTHLNASKTIERKFDEWILAYRLEDIYSKDQILTSYLNKINFHGAEGIQAAAQQYFGKNTSELGLAESAVLAAIPNAPAYYDPYSYDENLNLIYDDYGYVVLNENNLNRSLDILDKMEEQGYISSEEKLSAQEVILHDLELQYNNPNRVYSYFTDEVYTQVLNDLIDYFNTDEDEVIKYINTSGLKIYSTVDPYIQSVLEDTATYDDLFPERTADVKAVNDLLGVDYQPELGATIIDNEDGSILGLIGGRENNASLSLNRASTPYQTGSSTKPITVYAPALQEKVLTLESIYNDAPVNIDGWQPQNADKTFKGPTSVKDAIIHSVNTIAVEAFEDLGLDNSLYYARSLGLNIYDSDHHASALALGGYSIGQTTQQMAAAYSCLARGGIYIRPYVYTRIEDSNGNILINHYPEKSEVFSETVSYQITEALKEACTNGTAKLSNKYSEIAGKTGTTDDNVEAWFCGYSPNYSLSIWYGYDVKTIDLDDQTYHLNIGISGGNHNGPAGFFEEVMSRVESNTLYSKFEFDLPKSSLSKENQNSDESDPNNSSDSIEGQNIIDIEQNFTD